MSSTDGSERATEQSETDLDHRVERLQTIPSFQGLVDLGDASRKRKTPPTEWQFDDRARKSPQLGERRTETGREMALRRHNKNPTTDWAVWI